MTPGSDGTRPGMISWKSPQPETGSHESSGYERLGAPPPVLWVQSRQHSNVRSMGFCDFELETLPWGSKQPKVGHIDVL